MEVLLLVVGKEVSARCIEESFSQQEEQRNCGEFLHHPGEDEEHAPPHRQVKYQGKAGITVNGENLVERSTDDHRPKDAEHQPPYPSAHYTDADGGIGTGNHHVDTDMVALAQYALRQPRMHPMVDSAGKEHEEHAGDEEDDSHCHRPPPVHGRPYHPYG